MRVNFITRAVVFIALLALPVSAFAQVTAEDLMAVGIGSEKAELLASITSNLIPAADNTSDIGSSSLEYKDIYIDGTAYIDTPSIGGNVVAESNNAYNIGATGARFSNIYSAATVFTAAIQAGSGSGASPSITFESDSDTGLWRDGANQIGVSVGGSQRWRFQSAGDFELTTTGASIILKSPDGSSSDCSVDNSDNLTCTGI